MPSKKRLFSLRLEDDDYEKMKIIAQEDNRSMANAIELLVKERIVEYEDINGVIKPYRRRMLISEGFAGLSAADIQRLVTDFLNAGWSSTSSHLSKDTVLIWTHDEPAIIPQAYEFVDGGFSGSSSVKIPIKRSDA